MEPDLLAEADRNRAGVRLAQFLADCGNRRGDGLWQEAFEFVSSQEAGLFAAALRVQFVACAVGTHLGVAQYGERVVVRVIAEVDLHATDAIVRTSSPTAV